MRQNDVIKMLIWKSKMLPIHLHQLYVSFMSFPGPIQHPGRGIDACYPVRFV
jgi:hypothetical protein